MGGGLTGVQGLGDDDFVNARSSFAFGSLVLALSLTVVSAGYAQSYEVKPPAPEFEKFKPLQAPTYKTSLLKQGDKLAIIGDSITEQKMYSRMMETYLTVCAPELGITVRQYGWSGERASGFYKRMTNDCLRFHPDVATTCYGMNDHRYVPYTDEIGADYRANSMAIIKSFKANGVRMVQGSPGPVGKMPSWVKTATGTVEDLNMSLCNLRNMGLEMAQQEQVRFADVFWPMMTAGYFGKQKYGPEFMISGKDGVHPGWAGQTVMAYAFLKALGVDGDIGTFTIDLKKNSATASIGHSSMGGVNGEFAFKSTRYPYCATGPVDSDGSIRSGMTVVPFNEDLNRLMLVVKGMGSKSYKVTWGAESHTYTKEQLAKGVNLAADFTVNPFSEAFKKVEDAVLAKQSFETKQIKTDFRSAEAKADMEAVVAKTEEQRAPLAEAIKKAFVPVSHIIKIVAE